MQKKNCWSTLAMLLLMISMASAALSGCKKGDSSVSGGVPSPAPTEADLQEETRNETDAWSRVQTILNEGYVAGLLAQLSQRRVQVSGVDLNGLDLGIQESIFCNTSIVTDSTTTPNTITINYHGKDCSGNYDLEGPVVLTLPPGRDLTAKDALLLVDLQRLKITRLVDGKFIHLSGTLSVLNTTGGSVADILLKKHPGDFMIQDIRSDNMSMVFGGDSTVTSWHLAWQRWYEYGSSDELYIDLRGIGKSYFSGISDWGVDRYQRIFTWTTSYTSVEMKQSCGYNIVQGTRIRTFKDIPDTTVITYGFDKNGVHSPYGGCIDKYFYRYTEKGPHTNINLLLPQ